MATKQELQIKIRTLIESGYTAEEVAKTLAEENSRRAEEGIKEPQEEVFPDEIKVIAQALAFRTPSQDEVEDIHRVLESSYKPEVNGAESFRKGEAVTVSSVEELFEDDSYRWLVVETPNGHGIIEDGMLLGVSCYSTDGRSRKNGVEEGKLGSFRYLAVLPVFHGLCVGLRLLDKVEKQMKASGCVRSMVCLPSTRDSVHRWIERRGYNLVNTVPYPTALGHQLREDLTVELNVFLKDLRTSTDTIEGKTYPEGDVATRYPDSPASSDVETRPPEPKLLDHQTGGLALPPHWRNVGGAGANRAVSFEERNADNEVPEVD